MRKPAVSLLFLLILILPLVLKAAEFSSENFTVLDSVIQPGGFASSTNFQLTSAFGQIAVATSTAGSFQANAGFLTFPFVSAPKVSAMAGNGQAGILWTSVTGFLGWTVGGYNVGRATVSGGPYTYTSAGNVLYASSTGLTNGTKYYFIVRAEDFFGNSIATSSEISVTPKSVYSTYWFENHYIDTTTQFSETLNNSNGTKGEISLPTDVYSEALRLMFEAVSEDSVVSSKSLPSEKSAANTFYSISFNKSGDASSVTALNKSVTITFFYTDSDVSGIDEGTLALYRWDGSSWSALSNNSVDVALNKVSATTNLFSDFAILGSSSASPSSSSGAGTADLGDSGTLFPYRQEIQSPVLATSTVEKPTPLGIKKVKSLTQKAKKKIAFVKTLFEQPANFIKRILTHIRSFFQRVYY